MAATSKSPCEILYKELEITLEVVTTELQTATSDNYATAISTRDGNGAILYNSIKEVLMTPEE